MKVCTWLREMCSCSFLTVLPGHAWVLLSKTYKPLFTPLYLVYQGYFYPKDSFLTATNGNICPVAIGWRDGVAELCGEAQGSLQER